METGCYRFERAGSNQEAKTKCEIMGGFLVEIQDQEEQNAVYQFHQASKLDKIRNMGKLRFRNLIHIWCTTKEDIRNKRGDIIR